jgi:hypothetical protein
MGGSLFILGLGIALVAILFVVVPRVWLGPPGPEIEPVVLLLDLSSFPANWQADEGGFDRSIDGIYFGAQDMATRRYWAETSGGERRSDGFNDVASYGTASRAEKGYQVAARTAPAGDPWEEMAAWDYQPQADEYMLRFFRVSQASGQWSRVHFLARYGRYVTVLNLWVVAEDMRPEEMQRVIRMLDESLAQVKED